MTRKPFLILLLIWASLSTTLAQSNIHLGLDLTDLLRKNVHVVGEYGLTRRWSLEGGLGSNWGRNYQHFGHVYEQVKGLFVHAGAFWRLRPQDHSLAWLFGAEIYGGMSGNDVTVTIPNYYGNLESFHHIHHKTIGITGLAGPSFFWKHWGLDFGIRISRFYDRTDPYDKGFYMPGLGRAFHIYANNEDIKFVWATTPFVRVRFQL